MKWSEDWGVWSRPAGSRIARCESSVSYTVGATLTQVHSILASWDNEEYGLVGSTEFGEEYEQELSEHCVACKSSAVYIHDLGHHD